MSNFNISTVLKRLEAVTSRLEDLYEHTGKGAPQSSNLLAPTSSVVATAVAAPVPLPAPVPTQVIEDPPSVVAYVEQILKGRVQPFVKLTGTFPNTSVVEQAKLVERLYTNLGGIIRIAAICKKPDQAAFAELLSDLQSDIEAISAIKDSNRKEQVWFNHLSFVAEGSPAVAWITVENKPGPYVKDIKDTTQFYGNRIITEFKEKDKTHVEWVRAFTAIFDDMRNYVTEYHTTGLVWNAKACKIHASASLAWADGYSAAGGVSPPPPPPPPPGPLPPPVLPPASGGGSGVAAVFAELNRGSEVTKNLRKVDKNEMTHKNPALRASSTVPSTVGSSFAPKKPVRPAKPQALMGKKPAKFALEGNKWAIEYQENEAALTVDNVEIGQIVNLFGCKNSTILIKGKVNAVTIVNCTKTSVLVESAISSVSVTNSPSFTLQITGSAPTIQLDSTDSGQIFLSKDCLGVEITTAKCSSINVSLPVEGEEDGIFDEKPVPEMLLTRIQDGKLVTTVVEHVG
ncbi:adenylate cyclase associated N terminal-domain-containing protein [Russula earlei]|uniref:Adenylate cyclase associated N terminal-domain-containing protein n=1 Tax=Russula earlei TaxID=71964 RepID=A0ACC0UIH3_9AGAM|nr:adenylate cyclase associated N terminal-domain-containing protein [Russula earlei]